MVVSCLFANIFDILIVVLDVQRLFRQLLQTQLADILC